MHAARTSSSTDMRFLAWRYGKNITGSMQNTTVRRDGIYDGVVYSERPLALDEVFTIRIDEIDTSYGEYGLVRTACVCG